MVTLADVAAVAGVSAMTVSNVISGKRKKVSEATAARVKAAIRDTGYVVNSSARALSGQRSHIIAIVVKSDPQMLRNSHDARYVGELSKSLLGRGYYGMLLPTDDFTSTPENLRTWGADGVIFINTMAHEIESLHAESDIPMLFSDNYTSEPGVLSVRNDDWGGGQMAAKYFLQKGHNNAIFIGPVRHLTGVVDERYRGFRDFFVSAGMPPPEAPSIVTDIDLDSGVTAGRHIASIAHTPTAVLCSADELAVGVIHGLVLAGLRVPEDVSVIGFDGSDIGKVSTPELTTIAQDIYKKAERSVEILLHSIESSTSLHTPPLPLSLIERKSVYDRKSFAG